MLVTIIMPAYNAQSYIAESIQSVLDQTHQNWELLIINDGSTDTTQEIIDGFQDSRVKCFSQSNQGVSVARNVGLDYMTGDFFCFLDADDLMTQNSLEVRLEAFEKDSTLAFVTGGQEQKDQGLAHSIKIQLPSFDGYPRKELISLNGECFINCGTWMIKRRPSYHYQFEPEMSHSEDLAFFLSISSHGKLQSIPQVVQVYRRHDQSAMANLKKLETGYWQFYSFALTGGYFKNFNEKLMLRIKIRKIMFLSYFAKRQYFDLFKVMFTPF